MLTEQQIISVTPGNDIVQLHPECVWRHLSWFPFFFNSLINKHRLLLSIFKCYAWAFFIGWNCHGGDRMCRVTKCTVTPSAASGWAQCADAYPRCSSLRFRSQPATRWALAGGTAHGDDWSRSNIARAGRLNGGLTRTSARTSQINVSDAVAFGECAGNTRRNMRDVHRKILTVRYFG